MAERTDDQWGGTARPRTGETVEIDQTTVIRAEIVETRERMSDTLDEIGERLNPHLVKEQVTERVKEGIRDATIGRMEHMARSAADKVSDTRSGIADTIRENPIPAAMVAVGLGWLMWNGRKESDDDRYRRQYGYGARGPYVGSYPRAGYADTGYDAYGAGAAGSSGAYAGAEGDDESGRLDRARDRAGDLGHQARDRAGDLAHRAHDAAGSVAHGAHDLAGAVADRTRRGAGRVEDAFYDNPLAIGAVSMALGLAAGLAAPTTDREVQLMGGARDQLLDQVKSAVQDTAEKAQHVAERAVEEGQTAAREEGLTAR